MYAVIETGGKQYRVEVGTELEVELLDAASGESVAFERVLLVADGDAASIGRPVVANASVSGEILRRDRGEKLISFKYRPKARRRVKKGHRQELSVVRISDIVLDGKSAAADHAKAEEARKTERQRLEEAARKQAEQDAALAAKLATDKAKTEKSTAKAAGKPSKPPRGKADASKPATKASSRTAKADTTGAADKAKTTARPKPRPRATDAKSAPKKTQK
jgi:large subunit ribosomal protein L21